MDLLRPPPGYRLDSAVGTTYSCDFVALTAVMLAFVDGEPESEAGTVNEVEVLRAITRLTKRVRIFVNRARFGIHRGAAGNRVCSLFDSIIRDVKYDTGCFHPKVWAARYVPLQFPGSESMRPIVRFLCGSRNLTSAQYWEAFVRFEGLEGKHNANCHLSAQAAAFVQLLGGGDPTLHSLSQAMRRTDFLTSRECRKLCDFQWQLPRSGELLQVIPKRGKKMVLLSPFVRKKFVDRMLARFDRLTLISTQRELDMIEDDDFHRRLEQHDVYVVRTEDATLNVMTMDLHAKILLCEGDFGARSIIGSANASEGAWRGGNCEAVVSFSPGISIKHFIHSFLFNDDGKLWGWIERYERRPFTKNEEDICEQEMDEMRDRIGQMELDANYEAFADRLTIKTSSADVVQQITELGNRMVVEVCPISLMDVPGSFAVIDGLCDRGLEFEAISIGDLSEFIAFEVKHRIGDYSCVVLVKARTNFSHLLGDRDAAVLKLLLTKDKFRDFLQAILFDGIRRPKWSTPKSAEDDFGNFATSYLAGATLEDVLQSCTEDASRIDEIDALLKTFKGTGFVDPLFEQFWDTFRIAFNARRAEAASG